MSELRPIGTTRQAETKIEDEFIDFNDALSASTNIGGAIDHG